MWKRLLKKQYCKHRHSTQSAFVHSTHRHHLLRDVELVGPVLAGPPGQRLEHEALPAVDRHLLNKGILFFWPKCDKSFGTF